MVNCVIKKSIQRKSIQRTTQILKTCYSAALEEHYTAFFEAGVSKCEVVTDEAGPAGNDTAYDFKMYKSDGSLFFDGK